MFRGRMERLGWIRAPRASLAQWGPLVAFADAARRDGLTRVLVCGMGGSSLTADVVARACGATSLQVLDSTDPAAVLDAERAAPRDRTLFLVVSKSGTTLETLAFYRYFAARARPEQFVAVTDPGTPLEALAREHRFRAVFPHPPDVGGRYAALTVVGMLPAALIGVDGRVLLERALAVDVARAKAWGVALAREALAGRRPGAGDVGATLAPGELARAARPGDYLAILAYLPPRPDVVAALAALRAAWAARLGIATTLGFGPRYLHSTGQLHKGGPNTGLFLVLTADDAVDLEIPEMGVTFGRLKRAQAIGDIRALLAKGRRVAHVHLTRPEDVSGLAA